MDPQNRTVEKELARLASSSHGIVSYSQMLGAGLSAQQVKRRIQRGSLIRVYRGVYCVGHQAPSTDARYMAAVLACGDGAALSGRAAGWILSLLRSGPPAP